MLPRLASRSRPFLATQKRYKWGSNLPPNILKFQYAVRGELAIKASHYEKLLSEGAKLPFDRVTFCNIGNPHQLGQKPITFYRQVISLVENPELMKQTGVFPKDVIERAQHYLKSCNNATGAYSDSRGLLEARKAVAQFIRDRDGIQDPNYTSVDHIYLSNGASPAIQDCLKLIINGEKDGIMIPIPQYPLYSGSVPLLGGTSVGYYLDEDKQWGLNIDELSRAIVDARSHGLRPRALVVINPGNPTGSCLSTENIAEILKFAHREGLIVLADEVYQRNCYEAGKPFSSFKKVHHSIPDIADLPLLSFHSISKGLTGECGKRGGYVEMTGVDAAVHEQYYKLASMSLCPNVVGQLILALQLNPPKAGDPSYALFRQEEEAIFNSLKNRAHIVWKTLNGLEGIECQKPDGALYAFPKITLPRKAIEAATKLGKAPDVMYCLELLDETGLCVVPGDRKSVV